MNKNIIPYIFILFIGVIFASNYLFKGLVPFPSRYLVNHFSPWNTHSEFAFPVKNNAMPDVIGQIYPWKKFTIETWKKGEIPLWNPYSFSGTPHLANYQSQVFSPTNILYFFIPFLDAWSIQILLQPLLAGIFMYLYMRSIKLSWYSALMSSISFMFCGFITTWMAYGTLSYAVLYLPLALFSIERYFLKRDVLSLILLAVGICFSFFSGHFQTSIYVFGTVTAYILWSSFFAKNIKDAFFLLGGAFSGLFLSFPQILPSVEFYQNSVRELIIQKLEVIPWKYLPTRIAPDFYGNPVTRNDWFGHYAEWNSYAGIIPFFLSFLAFTKKIDRRAWFFLILFVFSLFLSFDSILNALMVQLKIPLLSTSAASRIIVLSSVSIAVLSGFGLERLVTIKKIKKIAPFILIWVICIGLIWGSVFIGGFEVDKKLIARNNSILPTMLFLTLTGCAFMLVVVRNQKVRTLLIVGLIICTTFEMLRFALKWMPFEEREFVYPETTTTKRFQKNTSHDRWYLDAHAENALIYKLPISDGYDPLYYKRYGELVKYVAEGKITQGERSLVTFPKNGMHTDTALDLLGIRYVAYRVSDGQAEWAFPYWTYAKGRLNEVFHDGKYTIFENSQSLPKAQIVYKIESVLSDEILLTKLFSNNFDSSNSAIVENNKSLELSKPKKSTIATIRSYKNNTVAIDADATGSGLLVLNDVLYPGWNVFVDGEKKDIERVNFIFRGVFLDSGRHAVEFKYQPESFKYGLLTAVFGFLGIVILSIINTRYAKKK